MRRLPVLVAGCPAAERHIAAAPGFVVVRECTGLAELLAAAAAGHGRVAFLGPELPRLDRTCVRHLQETGVAVVGVVPVPDAGWGGRLRRLGVDARVYADASPEAFGRVARLALQQRETATRGRTGRWGAGSTSAPYVDGADVEDELVRAVEEIAAPRVPAEPPVPPPSTAPPGAWPVSADEMFALVSTPPRCTVVAVWGPAGAPGRSTVASNLAVSMACSTVGFMPTVPGPEGVLLVDADTYGGVQARLFGLLDEAPGLLTAVRTADRGMLDAEQLVDACVEAFPGVQLLSGDPDARRWPEVRPAGLEAVLDVARSRFRYVIVDCGFCLEDDEELSYDTFAPRRNGATLTALAAADVVVAVGAPGVVGGPRFEAALTELSDAGVPTEGDGFLVVHNRVERGVPPLRSHHDDVEVPEDPAVRRRQEAGLPVLTALPRTPASVALEDLARRIRAIALRWAAQDEGAQAAVAQVPPV